MSSLKAVKRNQVSRKPETNASRKEPASPAKPSISSSKRTASPAKPSTSNKRAAASPRKPASSRAGTKSKMATSEQTEGESVDLLESSSGFEKRAVKRTSRKKTENSNDEKPAKRGRGRPKKTTVPAFVDRGTSP